MNRCCQSLLLGVLLAGVGTASAQWTQRTYALQPGWNAIFLDVHPEPAECDALLAGLPVESVWDFNPPIDAPQFVQDPATLIPGTPNWLTWFPATSPSRDVGNLSILRDGRALLIKLPANASPVNWTVTGRPSLRKTTWRAGGVNFVGFRVGPTGPTFQALFAGEAGLAGQPVYTLTTGGAWQQVANLTTTRPVAGRAYWVRCATPAKRTATIEVDPGSRQGIAFDGSAAESALRIRNTSPAARTISVRLLPSNPPPAGQPANAGPIPLEYWKTDFANVDLAWTAFPTTLSFTALPAGAEWNLRLGARLGNSAAGRYQGLLEVTDDLGTLWLVPVSADAGAVPVAAGAPQLQDENDFPQAGLWVGEAVINAVSQPAHPGDANLPRPAGGEFTFRLIVHVDAAGVSRLLQRVFVLRKPPTFAPDPENPGFNRIDQPARNVVLTDEALIPTIIGPGEIVGRRISSAAFGFTQPLVMSGAPFGAGVLNGTVAIGYDDPVNPFKHLYHPDHDNLDERFEQTLAEGRESFAITRNLMLEFSDTDPLGSNPPGWGSAELGGTYRETLVGLHRRVVHLAGSFRLVRVATTPTLNDGQATGLATIGGANQ